VSKDSEEVSITALGDGRYLVTEGTRRHVAFAVPGPETWVHLDGRTFVISEGRDGSRRRASGESPNSLSAPMPATVLAVHAEVGQPVKRDDVLVVLEAMKMELPLRAPRDGIVTRIGCQVGEIVQPGVTLIEIEGESRHE